MIKKMVFFIFKSISFLLLAIVIIAIGGLSALYVFQNIFAVPDTIVPSVIGDNLKTAQEKINSTGLKIVVEKEEYNRQVEENHIIAQNPVPNSKIKENREVKIVLSKGKKVELIEIPDLQNMRLDEAISLIEENGMILGRVTVTHHFSVPKDRIISQVPAPGDILSDAKTINLLVSDGKY